MSENRISKNKPCFVNRQEVGGAGDFLFGRFFDLFEEHDIHVVWSLDGEGIEGKV